MSGPLNYGPDSGTDSGSGERGVAAEKVTGIVAKQLLDDGTAPESRGVNVIWQPWGRKIWTAPSSPVVTVAWRGLSEDPGGTLPICTRVSEGIARGAMSMGSGVDM